MDKFTEYIIYIMFGLVAGLYVMMILHVTTDVHGLTVMGQYTVSNYTSYDSNFKIFLLSKEKLNYTILQNENDITDKLLVFRVHS
jgi:hypothetical protein